MNRASELLRIFGSCLALAGVMLVGPGCDSETDSPGGTDPTEQSSAHKGGMRRIFWLRSTQTSLVFPTTATCSAPTTETS